MTNCTTLDQEYISIYDRPKRPRGRPKTCTLTDEEKKQRKRDNAQKFREKYLDKKYDAKLIPIKYCDADNKCCPDGKKLFKLCGVN